MRVGSFTQVNDHYGHLIGDQVLVAAAQAMKQSLRETEALGRWGDDSVELADREEEEPKESE